MKTRFQTALSVIFPSRCVGCGALVEDDFGLCGACWGKTAFITGLVCDACGAPLPGVSDGKAVQCDDCLKTPRPWVSGRAVMLYRDQGRKMALALKHGGRVEIAAAAARWMEQAGADLLACDPLIAPVPLHWSRLFRRTFNQAAVLGQALADRTGCDFCPDLLVRVRRTAPLDYKSAPERFGALEDAVAVHARHRPRIAGRCVLLIDDVMTSGATLSAATRACQSAGSADVSVLTLARVVKDA